MKFKGNGIIWNPKTNRPLVKFVNGYCETEDPEVIKVLQAKGFGAVLDEEEEIEKLQALINQDGQASQDNPASNLPQDFQKLRKMAKEARIPDYMLKSKQQLLELLAPPQIKE